jgi:translation initiation factor 1
MRLFEGTQWDRPPQCAQCEQPEADCTCPPPVAEITSPGKQTAKLAVEKRRKGKVVTVIRNLRDEADHLPLLLKEIKSACGAGGTLKEGAIEIQGRQLDRVRDVLTALGYRTQG